MNRQLTTVLLSLLALGAGGCSMLPRAALVVKPSPSQVALEELAKRQSEEIQKLNAKILLAEQDYKQHYDANVSLGSASVLSVYDTMIADPEKDRYDKAEMAGVEVAIKALPEPSLKDYKKTTETQRKLLSELAQEVQDGKKEIEQQKALAQESKDAQTKALAEKAALEEKRAQEELTFQAEKEILNKKVQEEKDVAVAKAEQAATEAKSKSRKDLEKWVVTILMIVGVVAGIISFAIKGPGRLFSVGPAIGSAASIGLAIAVVFLPTWAIITGIALVFGLIITTIILEWKQEKDHNEVMIGAIEEEKQKETEKFKSGLAKRLDEWSETKPKIKARVDKKLKAMNLK